MEKNQLALAIAAYLSGRGYYVNTEHKLPGTDIVIDTVAVMPRMRELKPRMKRGFAPVGVLVHMLGDEWLTLSELEGKTGYPQDFISAILKDAMQDGWIELEVTEKVPRFRLKDYRIPAKECVLAFVGTSDLASKLIILKEMQGCYHRAYIIFDYQVDEATMEQVYSGGAGILRYYPDHGIFQESVPAEAYDIDDMKKHGLLVEKVLYDNFWIIIGEII